jgi:hypothetical protein
VKEAGDLGLTRLAQADPGVVERVRASLRVLARKGDPELRGVARQVLSGRTSVWEIPAEVVPEEAPRRALEVTWEALDSLSDKQREKLLARGRAEIAELARSLGPQQAPGRRGDSTGG